MENAKKLPVHSLFDPNAGHRANAEWRRLLEGLVASLSTHTGIRFTPTSWFINDHPGHASASGCVDIRASVSPALRLDACGVLCVTVNHGEAAWASADVLLYSGGRRVVGPDGLQLIHFRCEPEGWADLGWVKDEYGEWEGHSDDARWRLPEPGSAPASVRET